MIALHVLETCPLVPVDAFVHLAGLSSRSSAYQQLARLRQAGLADVRRVDPGYLVGERRLGCWTITEEGKRALAVALSRNRRGLRAGVPQEDSGAHRLHSQSRVRDNELPLLIASYRLLASLMLERAARGQAVEVQTWEWPWVREAWSATESKVLRAKMPAGATLKLPETAVNPDSAAEHLMSVVLVPDLATAPVVRYREMLRRLVTVRERGVLTDSSADAPLEVVVATPDDDGMETRSKAWQVQLDSIVRRHGAHELQVRVLTWDWVANAFKRMRCPDLVADDRPQSRASGRGATRTVRWPAPVRSQEQLLHLIGRHPCLTIDQLALLLGTAVDRIRRLETDLIEDGLLRRIEIDELPRGTDLAFEDFTALGLVEVTSKGRRRLGGWLGLGQAAATRYHGFIGNGRSDRGRRWRLLRALCHTLGANSVFVAFAVAADAVSRAGGSDQFVEWRGASACERNYCKPDGYGCYVRNGVSYGFFLEYDRGTERARHYAAKVRAYYRYRDSGQAARDYSGFPTVLFVTTSPIAEQRMADWSYKAALLRGTEPLSILTTTTDLISKDPQGILGPIWRTEPVSESGFPRQYWLPGRPPIISLVSSGIPARGHMWT